MVSTIKWVACENEPFLIFVNESELIASGGK